MSRTTKSGILIENGSGVTNVGSGLQSDSGGASSNYDDTVDSAMHIYEKLRRSRSGSLPSRRVKKNRHIASSTSSHSLMSGHAEPRSVTSRQHQNLSSESQNLSALNLSRAEELRTAKDLEEIKRALLALQHNSLGILGNIQFDHSVYAEGNNPSLAEFPALRLDSGAPPSTHPGHKPKKTRGPGVQYRCTEPVRQTTGPTFLRSPRKTTSTTNLINSGTESDNSYGAPSSVSASSRASSSLSSREQARDQVSTINSINSNIIQTANKMMSGQHSSQAGKLPLSLTGLLSPRHLPSLPPRCPRPGCIPPPSPPPRRPPSSPSPGWST